jgi:hypothetical protein
MNNNKDTHNLKSFSEDSGARLREVEGVNILIEKYFEGLTTLDEEQLLCDYFRNEDIPEALEMYQPIFQFFNEEKASAGKRMSGDDQKIGHPAFDAVSSEKPKLAVRKNLLRFSIVAAASLLLLFALKPVFYAQKTLPETSQAYINGKKYTNIELIQSEALKALENLSVGNDDVYSSQIEALDFFLDNN